MRSTSALIIAAAFCAGLAGNACASVVVNNGPPNQTGGSDANSFLEADNFTLAAASTNLNLVRFWALQSIAADYTGSISWSINQNSGGSPGASVASGSANPLGVATGVAALGFFEFSYQFAINATLAAGNYWLVLHNGPNNAQPGGDFYWEWSSDQGNSMNFDLTSSPSSWTSNLAELAFQLEARDPQGVPEPATLALVVAGLAAATVRGRRAAGRAA